MNPVQLVMIGAVSIAATAPIMGMFLPPVYEIRSGQMTVDPKGLRHALLAGGGIAGAVGIAASVGTGSSAPLVGAMLGAVMIALIYEWAIRSRKA